MLLKEQPFVWSPIMAVVTSLVLHAAYWLKLVFRLEAANGIWFRAWTNH